jgi:hypothetical protein
MSKVLAIFFTLVLLGTVLAGCSGVTITSTLTSTVTTTPTEPDYAGAITEKLLQAFNNRDWQAYMVLVDDTLAAEPESEFWNLCDFLREHVGTYVSKTWLNTMAMQDGSVLVIYRAKYTDEPDDVKVTIQFAKNDDGVVQVFAHDFISVKILQALQKQ